MSGHKMITGVQEIIMCGHEIITGVQEIMRGHEIISAQGNAWAPDHNGWGQD